MVVNITLNNKLNFNLLQKKNNKYKYIIVFNGVSYIKYVLSTSTNILFLKNLNYITINLSFFSKNKGIQGLVNNLNKSIGFYFLKKINFSGKGYKIKKSHKNSSKNTQKYLNFYFNKSHLNIVYFFGLKIKKLKKTKLLICSTNYDNISLLSNFIVTIKHFNPFTSKGLRLSRQVVYKKIGKKSS